MKKIPNIYVSRRPIQEWTPMNNVTKINSNKSILHLDMYQENLFK